VVELADVGFRVGRTDILSGVSAAFRPGRFNVILGPNGAGKSTLLRIAAGLLTPSAGAVRYAGHPVEDLDRETLARARAVLSQDVQLVFPLSVEDVVLMGRYPHYGRVPTARDRRIVEGALEVVDLTARRRQPYPTLSGGERQKVQLARVLAQIWSDDRSPGPKVLFLDEPTSNLDVHYQIHILDVARGLLAGDCTVVAVLHDLNAAFEYGDAFYVLEGGRLVETADSAERISAGLLERVFRVHARRAVDPGGGGWYWRFSR